MFDKIQGFTEIEKNIYVYKNFVLEDELIEINNKLDSLNDDEWFKSTEGSPDESPELDVLRPVLDRLVALMPEGFSVFPHTGVNRLNQGGFWGTHSDNADFIEIRELSKSLLPGQPFELVDNIVYGIVIYFNKFEGGDLFYTKKNLSFHPYPGDLVIHGAEEDCEHRVTEVLSEKRYSYSNSIREQIKIPI